MGPVDEQALAIRVEGKGIVLIVGCGHQGLANLLTRSAQLFDEPIYGMSVDCIILCRAVV